MIRTLIRLDPALRSLRASLPLALVAGLFLGALVSKKLGWLEEGSLGENPEWFVIAFSQIWLVLLLFMILSHITVRCARLSLALPLPTRKLWLARIFSIIIAGVLPLALLTLVLSLYPWMFQGGSAPDTQVLRIGALTGLGLILTAMLFQSPSPGLYSIRPSWRYILYAVVVSSGIPAVLLLGPRSLAVGFGFLAASVILALRTYRSLPSTLSLAPLRPGAAREPGRAEATAGAGARHAHRAGAVSAAHVAPKRGGFSALLHLTTFRVLVNHPLTWIILPVAAFFGYKLVLAYRSGSDLQPFALIILIWVVALLFQGIIRMHKLDPLPISRRHLLAYSILPVVIALALGIGVGKLHVGLREHQFKMIGCYCKGSQCDEFHINVPDDCWEIAWDGAPPTIASPWGESHVPKAHALYRGSNIALYNPYEVGETSSDAFIEMQLNRAIEKIHGVPAPQHEAGPAAVDDVTFRRPSKRGEAAVAWPEDRGSKLRSRTMATRALLLGIITAIIISIGLQQFRAHTPKHVYPWLLQGLAAPVLILLGGIYVADRAGQVSFQTVVALPEVLIRKLGEFLPLSTAAIWALAALILVGGYMIVLSRFKKIEAPVQSKKKLSEY